MVGYHVWKESVKVFLVYQWSSNPYLLPSPRDFVRLHCFSWTYAIQHARTIFVGIADREQRETSDREQRETSDREQRETSDREQRETSDRERSEISIARCGQVLRPLYIDSIGPC